MATKKENSPISTQELERLQAANEECQKIIQTHQETIERLKETVKNQQQKITDLEISNETALEKIKNFEGAKEIMGEGDSAKNGYVTIGTIRFAGKFPPDTKVDGIVIPRKIDGDVMYESVPVQTALRMLTEKSGYRRAYMGPKDKVEGDIVLWNAQLRGRYLTHVSFNRSKIDKTTKGEPYFVEVIVEEPEAKAE